MISFHFLCFKISENLITIKQTEDSIIINPSHDHLSCDCSIIVNVKLHESVGDLVHLRGDVDEQVDEEGLLTTVERRLMNMMMVFLAISLTMMVVTKMLKMIMVMMTVF